MSQTSYSNEMGEAVNGQLAYISAPHTTLTYNNPADEIPFGRAVAKVSGDEDGVELPDSATSDIRGIALRDAKIVDGAATAENAYPVSSAVAVTKRGSVRCLVDDDVTPDDDVYCRIADTLNVSTLVMSGAGSGDFVSGNSIAITVGGTAITGSPLAFNTDNATTLSALATLLQATDQILTAVSDGSHTITITSSNADMPAVNLTITGGATQATDTQTQTVAGVAGSSQGVFRADSDSGKAILVPSAKFLSTTSSGGLAIVDVNLD